jgi:hypothetical protein
LFEVSLPTFFELVQVTQLRLRGAGSVMSEYLVE